MTLLRDPRAIRPLPLAAMQSRFLTKAARERASPPTPTWSVLAGPIPPAGRAPVALELFRLAEHEVAADATWLLTAADYAGASAHLWMPTGDRHVRLDVLLIPT